MPSADEIRTAQKQTWDKFSSGWEKWDDVVMSTMGDVGQALIDSVRVAEDQQHLDVGAGTGEPGLSIAGARAEGSGDPRRSLRGRCSPRPNGEPRRKGSPTSSIGSVALRTCPSPTRASTA